MPRYIDADRMKENIIANQSFKERMWEWIDAQPTQDVAPVVHAKWEPAFMGLEIICSNCRKSPHNSMQYDYCPFCGAKMSKCDEGYFTVICKV